MDFISCADRDGFRKSSHNLLKDLKTEEKVNREKEYQRVAEGSEGNNEILMEANELVAPLETRLKVIARIGQ